MEQKKLKVAFICHVTNSEIREHLNLKTFKIENAIRKLLHRKTIKYVDNSIWSTLTFKYFESIEDIELHAIIPHLGVKDGAQHFEIRGIHYHVFNQYHGRLDIEYKKNRRNIIKIIESINPDVINMQGIESPFYSMAALDIDVNKYPFMVSLQTFLSDPDFLANYPIDKKTYTIRSNNEQQILKRVRYVGSRVSWYRHLASKYNSNLTFVKYFFLSEGKKIEVSNIKDCDFAYWSANINKAGEDALRAFAIVCKKYPDLKLNMIGYYSPDFKVKLESIMDENGIRNNVILSGFQSTLQEVYQLASKSRFALIPIKIDTVSTTIKEALQMEMPVCTYITKGTPSINKEKQRILLAENGNYKELGKNMIRLIEEPELGPMLIKNSKDYLEDSLNVEKQCRIHADVYHAIYEHFHYGTPIPQYLSDATI